jgi:hypothetical protein
MARLILDDGGKRRAFKLNPGRMTIGSGEGATLRLESPDVAETHAELQVKEDGSVTLVPRPGVMPPTLLGRPVKEATPLAGDAEFKIGGASFVVQSDGAGAKAAPASPVRAPQRAVARGAAAPRTAARPAAESGGGRVQRRRRTVERGIPTWAVIGILAVIAVVALFFGKGWLEDGGGNGYDPAERYREAVSAYNEGAYKRTLDELERVDLERSGPELREQVKTLRKQAEEGIAAAAEAEHNVVGTKWLDTNIKRYQENYLSGDRADRARARLFVKRCDDFRRRWPRHPEMEWIDRYRSRYAKLAEMDTPDRLADVQWEVERLTAAKPRDYALVFRLIDRFLEGASGSDATTAEALRATQVQERQEYFTDRMQQARYEWERQQYGQAVEWLVQLIIKVGDSAMEDQAADALLKMVNQEGQKLTDLYLENYRTHRPEDFERMMRHGGLRAAAQAAGIY